MRKIVLAILILFTQSCANNFLEGLSKPLFVRMTGSGSAIVAYFHTKKDCDKSMMQFRKQYKKHWCISSKTI